MYERLASASGVILVNLLGLWAWPDVSRGGACYTYDKEVFCRLCPDAACDPECEAYSMYDPCRCEPESCDFPIDCTPEPDGIRLCIDPPCTFTGMSAKYIVAIGSEYEGQYVNGVLIDPPFFVAQFENADQTWTCFLPHCKPIEEHDDLEWYTIYDPCRPGDLLAFSQYEETVPGSTFVFWIFRYPSNPGCGWPHCGPGLIQPTVTDCSGLFELAEGGGHYAEPCLSEWGGPPPQEYDPPKHICLGTMIRLTPGDYCHEAYLNAGSCFQLYKKCPPSNILEEIQSGDPLASLLDSGCEIWVEAKQTGYCEIKLTGEDTWGRRRNAQPPLRYEVTCCYVCAGECYNPLTHDCCPATDPAYEKLFKIGEEKCCMPEGAPLPQAITYNPIFEKCCSATQPENWKKVNTSLYDCCGPTAEQYDINFFGCCGPSTNHDPPLWFIYPYASWCCDVRCGNVPRTKPPDPPPYACMAPECTGENFCCGSDGIVYEAVAITDTLQLRNCSRLVPKWENPSRGTSNGCGSEGFHPPMASDPLEALGCPGYPFSNGSSGPCDLHDFRYGNCGCGKQDADLELYNGIRAICEGMEDGACKTACFGFASAYYEAVNNFGGPSYESGQVEDCNCCQLP